MTLAYFAPIIAMIASEYIKAFIAGYFNEVCPDYFWKIPASSSGKYHPSFALGEGGLVRHTMAACMIAVELFKIIPFRQKTKDMILAALLMHDTFKQGEDASGHTITEHPLVAAKHIREYGNGTAISKSIARYVSTHMGQWTTNQDGVKVLRRPITFVEWFVHLCDYLASRKIIEVLLP